MSKKYSRPMKVKQSQILQATLLFALGVLATGCVQFEVGVSGFSNPAYSGGRSYWLVPGNEGFTDENLEYLEYARYVRRGLAQAGNKEAPALEEADIVILLSYGIGDAKEHNYSYSSPIYGQTGGGVARFHGTTYSRYGSSTASGTIYQQPQFGVVGSQETSGTYTTHVRYLALDAVEGVPYRTEKKAVPIWRTDVTSRGSSSDLRLVFPAMVVAATPYFGKNTKERIVVNVDEMDKRLEQMKSDGSK